MKRPSKRYEPGLDPERPHGAPSRELVRGAVVLHEDLAKHYRRGEVNSKGVVMDISDAPSEHPEYGKNYRVVRMEGRAGGGRYADSGWVGAHRLKVLGRVSRLPRVDVSRWGELDTVGRLSLAVGNRVRVAGTRRCGTVLSVSRTDYMGAGHRAVVEFDDDAVEEFFSGRSADGRRLVRGGCGDDLLDPLATVTYWTIEGADADVDRLRAEAARRHGEQRATQRRISRYSVVPHARCEDAGRCVEPVADEEKCR